MKNKQRPFPVDNAANTDATEYYTGESAKNAAVSQARQAVADEHRGVAARPSSALGRRGEAAALRAGAPLHSADIGGRHAFAPEYPPYGEDEDEIYSSGAASANECTGLSVTPPDDETEAEALRDLEDVPVTPKHQKNSI